VGSFAENGSSDVLALRVFNFDGNRFGSSGAASLHSGDPAGKNHKGRNTGNRFHLSSLLMWID
jgi:hypothetical protein